MQGKPAFKIKEISREAPGKLVLILETCFHSRLLFLAQLKRMKIKFIIDRLPFPCLYAGTEPLQV